MNKKIGFIGCGKMAQAMIEGMLVSEIVSREQLMVSAGTEKTVKKITDEFHINATLNNEQVAHFADILFLAVKPAKLKEVLPEISTAVSSQTILVSVAASIEMAEIERMLDKKAKLIRTLPNTPAQVQEGMTAVCVNEIVDGADLESVITILNSFGKTEIIKENLMDSIPAISGSSPAYVYQFIEAMADGGVRDGIPRSQAYRLAAQAVLGAAKMVLETGRHPGELKDDVCTPGGSTIEAIAALEQNQFRGAVLEAMKSCTAKTKSYK